MTGSQKSLGKGSPVPGPVPEGIVRLYSMRFCPYAQRARLVLLAKGIKHEVININLKNKPEWIFEKNPSGLVPVLETSKGEIVYESLVVCDYLDEVYPEKKLTPEDPYQKALQKMTLEHLSGVVPTFYKILTAKKGNQDLMELKGELVGKLQKIDEILAKRNTAYFGGDSVSMIDYMIWPWFERLVAVDMKEEITGSLGKWYENMLQDPAVKETFTEPNMFLGFFKLYTEDNLDAVDYGL